MDFEYIEHIKGSPYITEGRWDQFKAKAAQQMGALGAMAGHQIQDPSDTKIRSLWEGFMKNLKRIMKDWESQVDPMFDLQVQLNPNEQEIRTILNELSRVLKPIGMAEPIGQVKNLGYHADPGVRNPRDNPDTYLKGYAGKPAQPSMKLKTLAPKQSDYSIEEELEEEGFWDAANRDLKLNKALGSNNPAKILTAYKTYILSLWQGFMKDAIKMTGLTKNKIYAKLVSQMKGTGNMPQVVKLLQRLQATRTVVPNQNKKKHIKRKTPAGYGGPVPPVIGQQPPPIPQQPAPYTGPVPPVIGQQPPPIPQQETPPPQKPDHLPKDPTPTEYDPQIPGQQQKATLSVTPQEIPYIILKAIRIIIDAVSSDKSHVGQYFTAPNLPTKFKQDISEIDAPPKSNKPKDQKKDTETDDFEPIPGEFVYNFHGNFRKSPGTNFSIQVQPVHEKPEIEQFGISVEVWWSCTDTENEIYAVAMKEGAESDPILIMKFSDHETSSKMGASNPYDQNAFSIEKIVNQSDDPGAEKKLDPKFLGQEKFGQVMNEMKKLQNLLLRSLMVVTARKAKEFKPKTKNVFPITYDDKGNVTFTNPETKQEQTITIDKVKEILKGDYEQAQKWKETLDHYDYFDHFPIEVTPPDQYPAWKEAEYVLMTKYGQNEGGARKILVKAWMELSKTKPQDQITAEDLVSTHTGGAPPPTAPETFDTQLQKYPALNDAYLAVLKLNGKKVSKEKSKEQVENAWNQLIKTKKPEDITTQEIIPLATKLPPSGPPAGASSGPPASKESEKKLWVDTDGTLMYMNDAGEEKPISKKQAVALAKKSAKFAAILKKSGIELDKLKERFEIDERAVNPFQLSNFL